MSRLRSIRRALEVTQTELARRTGYSQPRISRLEHKVVVGDDDRRRLALALGVAPELIG
jgi:transcriptional regulator with XRE-family HTH domain